MKTKPISYLHIIPNFITLMSTFCGLFSIINSALGNIHFAIIALIIAAILDALDGRVARMTNTETEFGAQLDSLSDLISFGVAPAILVFFGLELSEKIGYAYCFIYVLATAIRLARFNVIAINNKTLEHKSYNFIGLPCPIAALSIISLIWIIYGYDYQKNNIVIICSLFYGVLVSVLMLSSFSYNSFKKFSLANFISKKHIALSLIIAFAILIIKPIEILFFISFVYILFFPINSLYRYLKIKLSKKKKNSSKTS